VHLLSRIQILGVGENRLQMRPHQMNCLFGHRVGKVVAGGGNVSLYSMGKDVHARIRRHGWRHTGGERGIQRRIIGQKAVVDERIFHTLRPVCNDGKPAHLGPGPAGGWYGDEGNIPQICLPPRKIDDGFCRIDGGSPAERQHRVRSKLQNVSHALSDHVNVRIGRDLRKNPELRAMAGQTVSDIGDLPAFFHKSIRYNKYSLVPLRKQLHSVAHQNSCLKPECIHSFLLSVGKQQKAS